MKQRLLPIVILLAACFPALAGSSAVIGNNVYTPAAASDSPQAVPATEDQSVSESHKAHGDRSDCAKVSENAWPASMVTGTLPVVYINTQDAAPIVDKVNPIPAGYYMDPMGSDYAAEGSAQEPIALTIRGRGNSTWLQPKKPYKLKFDKKQSLFGLPKSKHYALMAHCFSDGDVWQANLAGFEMSRMLGMGWAPHMVPVELVLNGRYEGVYFIQETIKIDANRLDMFEQKDGETDPSILPYGWLIEIDNNGDEYQYAFEEKPGGGKILFTYKAPEELSQEQKDWLYPELRDLNDRVHSSSLDDPRWAEKLDVNTLAMYAIVREVLQDFDGYSGSFYMHKDKAPDAKWTFGPMWDCQMHWMPKDNYLPFSQYAEGHRFKWMPRIMEYSLFGDTFRKIWKEFYTTENFDKLEAYIKEFAKDLGPAFEMNNIRWKDELKPTQLYDPVNRGDYIMGVLRRNAAWINDHLNIEEIARHAAGVESVTVDPDAPEEYFSIDGMRLSSRPTAPGIYIMRKGTKTVKIAL